MVHRCSSAVQSTASVTAVDDSDAREDAGPYVHVCASLLPLSPPRTPRLRFPVHSTAGTTLSPPDDARPAAARRGSTRPSTGYASTAAAAGEPSGGRGGPCNAHYGRTMALPEPNTAPRRRAWPTRRRPPQALTPSSPLPSASPSFPCVKPVSPNVTAEALPLPLRTTTEAAPLHPPTPGTEAGAGATGHRRQRRRSAPAPPARP